MAYYMGIEGSNGILRLCVIDDALTTLSFFERKEPTNPDEIGRQLASEVLTGAVTSVIDYAYLDPGEIVAVGYGVAGVGHDEWLSDTLEALLPDAVIVPSSVAEISLVGGRSEPHGILLSAGADSFAYGANLAGDTAYLGGWGYLMGADGSSYWIGMEALRAVALAEDRRGITTMLTNRILAAYGLASARDLYGWLYREQGTPQPVLVNIAGMVMTAAEKGDEAARKIIERAASQLGALYRAVGGQINLQSAPVVFHGALLEKDTPLRTSVMAQLGLREIPERDHKPVTGAALLAKLATRSDVLI